MHKLSNHAILVWRGGRNSIVLCLWCAWSLAHAQAVGLPRVAINLDDVTVSGFSSGGFMAVQFHLAHAASVRGAGVFAGGPYECAGYSLTAALLVCTCYTDKGASSAHTCGDHLDLLPPQRAIRRSWIDQLAAFGQIDGPAKLRQARVWLAQVDADPIVPAASAAELEADYRSWLASPAQLRVEHLTQSAHAIPVSTPGSTIPSLLPSAQVQLVRSMLGWLYPAAALPPLPFGTLAPPPTEFDQRPYLGFGLHGMAQRGFLFVPAACWQGGCGLHVVFHGCNQAADAIDSDGLPIGDQVIRRVGHTAYAERLHIVLLFPQVAHGAFVYPPTYVNQQGCWDFWGYTGYGYATRFAPQIGAVQRMIEELGKAP